MRCSRCVRWHGHNTPSTDSCHPVKHHYTACPATVRVCAKAAAEVSRMPGRCVCMYVCAASPVCAPAFMNNFGQHNVFIKLVRVCALLSDPDRFVLALLSPIIIIASADSPCKAAFFHGHMMALTLSVCLSSCSPVSHKSLCISWGQFFFVCTHRPFFGLLSLSLPLRFSLVVCWSIISVICLLKYHELIHRHFLKPCI